MQCQLFITLIFLSEEAENERMHLMTALELKQPGALFRGVILLAQGEHKLCYCKNNLLELGSSCKKKRVD